MGQWMKIRGTENLQIESILHFLNSVGGICFFISPRETPEPKGKHANHPSTPSNYIHDRSMLGEGNMEESEKVDKNLTGE